ncbi:MAG TPA: hypothetical protein VGE34_02295 [Candidatus Saccharimonadales bacterium]
MSIEVNPRASSSAEYDGPTKDEIPLIIRLREATKNFEQPDELLSEPTKPRGLLAGIARKLLKKP